MNGRFHALLSKALDFEVCLFISCGHNRNVFIIFHLLGFHGNDRCIVRQNFVGGGGQGRFLRESFRVHGRFKGHC